MSSHDPTVIAGYRIERKLGEGGMGAVYAARHPRLGRLDAVKVLAPALSDDPSFRARFEREAQIAARMEHSNIVPVYDAGEDGGRLWLSMRLIDGPTAAEVLARTPGGLPPGQVVDICLSVARALDFAHSHQLLHRDVKPENILIDPRSRPPQVLLSDFGIARAIGDTSLTATGSVIGTADYSAPEHLRGEPTDGRADQYSLACTAAYLLTGVKPFRPAEPGMYAVIALHLHGEIPVITELRPGLPTAVNEVFRRGLAKDPAQRYGSCEEFVTALRSALVAPASTAATVLARAGAPAAPTVVRATRPLTGAAGGPAGMSPVASAPIPTAPGPRDRGAPWGRIAAIAAVVLLLAGGGTALALGRGGDEAGPAAASEGTADRSGTGAGAAEPSDGPGVSATAPPISTDRPISTVPSISADRPSSTDRRQVYPEVRTTMGAIDPCTIPAPLLAEGGMQTPLGQRTTPAGQAIICGSALNTAGHPDVIIGGYVRGSTWETSMLGNYSRGTTAFADKPGWRSYDMTERDGAVWCKYGYVAPTAEPYALEIATIRVPGARSTVGSTDQAERDLACTQLRAVAAAIAPVMPGA